VAVGGNTGAHNQLLTDNNDPLIGLISPGGTFLWVNTYNTLDNYVADLKFSPDYA
jgi:hypothetical protein